MAMNAAAAHAVEDASQVAATRRTALALANQIGFSEERAGRAALVTSELATNLAKHAKGGEILFRAIRKHGGAGSPEGIEILAIDRGPGMPDVGRAREDGYSTAGAPGHGLRTVGRAAGFFLL